MELRKEADIQRAKIKKAKRFTEEELKRRLFCRGCLNWKAKKTFKQDDNTVTGYTDDCRDCIRERNRNDYFMRRLINKEKYHSEDLDLKPDKVIGGRRLVSRANLAVFLDVSERTLARYIKKGELIGYNFLGKTFFKPEHISEWLEKRLGEEIDISDLEISE